MTKDNMKKYFDAVDVVCGECYGTEETCEVCPVRINCDNIKRTAKRIEEARQRRIANRAETDDEVQFYDVDTSRIYIDSDKYGGGYSYETAKYVDNECVGHLLLYLVDTRGLVKIADKIRKAAGFLPYYEDENGECDSELWYEFSVQIGRAHDRFVDNAGIAFEVCNTDQDDCETMYFIPLTEDQKFALLKRLNQECLGLYSKTVFTMVDEAEKHWNLMAEM